MSCLGQLYTAVHGWAHSPAWMGRVSVRPLYPKSVHTNCECLFLSAGISHCLGQVNKAVCREEDRIFSSFVHLSLAALLQSAAIKRQGEFLFFSGLEEVNL